MTRKIIAGVVVCVLLASIALFAAEKAKGKKPAAKPKQQAKNVEKQSKQKGLLDQLISAYKADDKAKMGAIIKKMEARRDKMQKLAKLNKWHRQTHRRWAAAGVAQGQGRRWAVAGRRAGRNWAAGGPGFNRNWAGARWGGQPRRWAASAPGGEFCRTGWGPQARMQRPMNRWSQQPGRFQAMQQWGPGQKRNVTRGRNIPAGPLQRPEVPPDDCGW
jgi:hypothetical protein